MSTNLSITKSTLAKLLAGENIKVVHKRISTAMFDLKTRTLYVPIWEDMNGELYDLLMGHEVGHALNTPPEGWHSATHDANGKFLGSFKDVLNVCEDARIEKLIKRKYPGLSKSFVEGYKNLFERDFFGIKRLKDYSRLNLIDRVNLYAKCGAFLIVPFNDEERAIVREVESTENWEEVVVVATKLFAKAKEDQDKQMNSLQDLTKELLKQFEDGLEDLDLSDDSSDDDSDADSDASNDDSDEESDESGSDDVRDELRRALADEESDEDSDEDGSMPKKGEEESDDEETGEGNGDTDDEDADADDKDDVDGKAGDKGGKDADGETHEDEEPQSITDRKFREKERELVTDAVEVYTYNLPKPDLSRIIVPNKAFLDNFYEKLAESQRHYGKQDPIVETCAKRFAENNNRYINLLVKEFEMRKNARQYARTETARTGEIDMSKLHKYKYSNDIFRKINVVPKGKSHGMIMYVDMSVSMDSMFGPTMEQTLALVAFCRKVGIPFDVYGFSDKGEYLRTMSAAGKLPRNMYGQKFTRMNDDRYHIDEAGFHLIHFISSQFGGNHYRRAFDAMCVIAMNWKNRRYSRTPLNWDAMGLDLGGTPFTQCVMASRPMIERFKAETKTDIVNVVYLTDGDGTGCFDFYDVKSSPINPETGKPRIENKIFLIDQKTRQRIELTKNTMIYSDAPDHQVALTEFVRSITGCKHIGFYVADAYSVRGKIRNLKGELSEEQNKAIDKFWRENDYYSAPNIGYDMYYYVKANTSNINDADYSIDADAMTGKKIAKVFTEAQNDKRKHRVLVSKFAQDIAA